MKLSELKPKAPKILLYGPAGRGKTALSLTYGEGALIIDLDDGLMSGMTINDQFRENRMNVEAIQCHEDDPLRATAFIKAKNEILKVVNACKSSNCKIEILIIDSLTALSDYALRQVLSASNMIGKQPQIQHWGLAFLELENVILMLRSLPIPVVLIAHDQMKTVDEQNLIEIAVPGKNLPAKITRFFDEVLYMKVTGASAFPKFVVQTKSTGNITARSRANIENFFDTSCGMKDLLKKMGYEISKKEIVKPNKL